MAPEHQFSDWSNLFRYPQGSVVRGGGRGRGEGGEKGREGRREGRGGAGRVCGGGR